MENLTISASVRDRENARENIIRHIKEIEDENVLRSVVFILGDYMVSNDGEDRAKYITAITYNLAAKCDTRDLALIYAFANGFCEKEDRR